MRTDGSGRTLGIVGVILGVAVAAAVVVVTLMWGTGFSPSNAATPESATPAGTSTPTTRTANGADGEAAGDGSDTAQDAGGEASDGAGAQPETVTVTMTVPVASASTAGIVGPAAASSAGAAPPAAAKATTSPRAPRIGTLFNEAYYSPYAAKKPSVGGVRLATLPDVPKQALTGKFIVLDPGHNGVADATIFKRQVPMGGGKTKPCNTSGTQTDKGYPEHAHNWDVVINLAALLRERGATVILTRPNDAGVGPCVDERANIGNRARADLVVSVHADGNTSRSARGFHIITSTSMAGGASVTNKSARMATVIRDEFAMGTGMPRSTYTGGGEGITRRADIAGLNLSTVPAVMLEAGNMRSTGDAALLSNPTYRLKEAHALAAGIQKALGR